MQGERILEFDIVSGLHVGNTWFKKGDTHLITHNSGDVSAQINYILYRRSFSNAVNNVKAIPKEECVKQHHMVVCDFNAHIPHVKKCKFWPRIRIWKLKDLATAS